MSPVPDVSFANLLVVCLVAVAAPLLVGFLPWLRVPAVLLEIVAGIVLAAGQVLWKGRLSEPHRTGSMGGGTTLEPRERARALHPKHHWPSIVLVALGIVLMLAEAAV